MKLLYLTIGIFVAIYVIGSSPPYTAESTNEQTLESTGAGCPYTTYLPIAQSPSLQGTASLSEINPNSKFSEANGPIASDRTINGQPEDEHDIFWIEVDDVGDIEIDLDDHTASTVWLAIYDSSQNLIEYWAWDGTPVIYSLTDQSKVGQMYVHIHAIGNYNDDTQYALTVTFPEKFNESPPSLPSNFCKGPEPQPITNGCKNIGIDVSSQITPHIGIVSATFIHNGKPTEVQQGGILRIAPETQFSLQGVDLCVDGFEQNSDSVAVSITPIGENGVEFTPVVETPGRQIVVDRFGSSGPPFSWTAKESWKRLSLTVIHYPEEGGLPGCGDTECERDFVLSVQLISPEKILETFDPGRRTDIWNPDGCIGFQESAMQAVSLDNSLEVVYTKSGNDCPFAFVGFELPKTPSDQDFSFYEFLSIQVYGNIELLVKLSGKNQNGEVVEVELETLTAVNPSDWNRLKFSLDDAAEIVIVENILLFPEPGDNFGLGTFYIDDFVLING